jgi:hypothetical protein
MAQQALLVRPELMAQREIRGLRVQLEPLARLSQGLLAQRDLPDHLAPPAPLAQLDHKERLAQLALLALQVLPEPMDLLALREPVALTGQLAPQVATGLMVQLAQQVRREHLGQPDPPDLQALLHLSLDPLAQPAPRARLHLLRDQPARLDLLGLILRLLGRRGLQERVGQPDPPDLPDQGLLAPLELAALLALLAVVEAAMERAEISFLLTTLEVSNGRHINTNLYADA